MKGDIHAVARGSFRTPAARECTAPHPDVQGAGGRDRLLTHNVTWGVLSETWALKAMKPEGAASDGGICRLGTPGRGRDAASRARVRAQR